MTTIALYSGGGVSLSPHQADDRTMSAYVRLVADEGRAITDGSVITTCADVLSSDVAAWTDCDAQEDGGNISADDALAELMEVLA